MSIDDSAKPGSIPTIAFVGESQVGKSSLINALIGTQILPTYGGGAPCTQSVCECTVGRFPSLEGPWQLRVEWVGGEQLATKGSNAARARIARVREKISTEEWEELDSALMDWRRTGRDFDLSRLLVGQHIANFAGNGPLPSNQARRHLKTLLTGWTAEMLTRVSLSSPRPESRLVDLPGFGHDDVGGTSAARWLHANASAVDAVVCVLGTRTPDVLWERLQEYWTPEQLRERLFCVATHGDEHVNSGRAADIVSRRRRIVATKLIARAVGGRFDDRSLLAKTFCCDPRPPSSDVVNRVEFDGELERLRTILAAVQAHARPWPLPNPQEVEPRSPPSLVDLIETAGLRYQDNRPVGGALWAYGKKIAVKKALARLGILEHFSYVAARRCGPPGWYTCRAN